MLSRKVQHALIKAKLESYLGFLHSIAKGKPSLVCDFMELYRYLVDDFVIRYCNGLKRKDFIVKSENLSAKRKGKREKRYNQNWEGSLNFEKVVKYLPHFKSAIQLPIFVLGIDI